MSALPNTGISPALSIRWDTARRLGDLLDILVAIRIDVGHSANGVAASRPVGQAELREVRALLDGAIATAKETFESVHHLAMADVVHPFPRAKKAVPIRRMTELSQTPF